MKRSSRPRKTANLSESTDHHLDLYALAATAAGVGMLALAQPAEARIVYTPAYRTIGDLTNPLFLDLNHDGVNDFRVYVLGGFSTGSWRFIMEVRPANSSVVSNQAAGCYPFSSVCAAALPAGVAVGPRYFSRHGAWMATMNVYTNSRPPHYGFPWANGGKGVEDRYLGLRFVVGGQIHYGWARFNVSPQPSKVNMFATLTGYAYETVPNRPIVTGDTGPVVNGNEAPDASLTTPASPPVNLGMLALGAPGLEIWRKEH
jgi:hypothetical protein